MRSGMAVVSANVQYRQILKERDRIMTAFASDPHTKHRATIKIAKMILLSGPYVFQGELRDIKAEPLGAGVYELSVKPNRIE